MKYSPTSGSLLKERRCTTTGFALSSVSAASRRAFPRKSSHPISPPDCEWWMLTLHIFPFHRDLPPPLLSTREPDCNIQCVHCVAKTLYRRDISTPPEWLYHLFSAVESHITTSDFILFQKLLIIIVFTRQDDFANSLFRKLLYHGI